MGRQLTEKQQKFLAVLFDEAGGDMVGVQVHVQVVGVGEELTTPSSTNRVLPEAAEMCLLKKAHGPCLRSRDAAVSSSAHIHRPHRPCFV